MTLTLAAGLPHEQPVVEAAVGLFAGQRSPLEVIDAFRRSTLVAQQGSPLRPAAAVSMVDGAGAWLAVWTRAEWMATRLGACRWWSTTGADLLDNILPELSATTRLAGVVVDLGQPHQIPIPCPTGDRELSRWSV